MKLKLFIGSLVVIGISTIYLFFFAANETPEPAPTGTPSLPIATSSPNTSIFPSGTRTITIITRAGTKIMVLDFINNGQTVADAQNPGRYYLAGEVGYCLPDGSCPAGAPAEDYNVVYDLKEQFFTISLLDEPIGSARKNAEAFLLKVLGISQTETCNLNYYVGTSIYVNETYAGKNLGFSYCPGATKLPQ